MSAKERVFISLKSGSIVSESLKDESLGRRVAQKGTGKVILKV